ncbi:hypothetical protein FAGKG844_40214 [Frankia sp. AgKG'84/4]
MAGRSRHDDAHRLVHIIGDRHDVQVGLLDETGPQGGFPQPVDQPGPVVGADEDDREPGDLAGLDEGEGLEQLVEGAQPAGQDDESLRVLDEHRLAHEEIAEAHAEVDPVVEPLFERKLDAEAHGKAARLLGAAVDRLHRAWTAAGDDGEAGLGEAGTQASALRVDRVLGGDARRAEHGDRPRQLREQPEALDELALDPQHPPRVAVHEPGRATGVKQPLVGGGTLDLAATGDDGPAELLRRRKAAFPPDRDAAAFVRPGGLRVRGPGHFGTIGHSAAAQRDRPHGWGTAQVAVWPGWFGAAARDRLVRTSGW